MSDKMIDATCERLKAFADNLGALNSASSTVLESAQRVLAAEVASENLGAVLHAVHLLLANSIARLTEQARTTAAQLGWQVATYLIAPIARESSEPVEFITGNSYMPPLRAFDPSETVWQLDHDGALWEAYSEAIERALDDEWVLMGAPEYDNALYVVDLRRWTHVDDDSVGDSLNDEWRAISE